MRMIGLALAGAAMLAGCGGPSGGGNQVAPTATPDPMEAKINALNDNMRKLTFFRAIYDAGYTCKEITKVETLPRTDGKATWHATCDDGMDYVIALQPGGIFYVSGVPQTRPRFKSAKDQPAPTPAP